VKKKMSTYILSVVKFHVFLPAKLIHGFPFSLRIFLGKQKLNGEIAKKIMTTFAFRYASYFLYGSSHEAVSAITTYKCTLLSKYFENTELKKKL